ncbi:hypothetical protein COCNU_01G012740 [Cocos nucifera]|uniref:Peptidase A1 domain-containing protein n=1 Tax=Cocos nucifera TaxID=13894 RepID=A0A8K0MVD7_COCNU|nr:hypothetical protein COCNU_01G012740 [Cocos nucifera]
MLSINGSTMLHPNQLPGTLLASTAIPAHAGEGEYITTVDFGIPKLDFTVIFDTGSDLSWIQRKPCVGKCYPQKEPLFDPSHFATYSHISCSSDDCSLGSDDFGCDDSSNCVYKVRVGYGGDFGDAVGLIGLGHGQESLGSQVAKKMLLTTSPSQVASHSPAASNDKDEFSHCSEAEDVRRDLWRCQGNDGLWRWRMQLRDYEYSSYEQGGKHG